MTTKKEITISTRKVIKDLNLFILKVKKAGLRPVHLEQLERLVSQIDAHTSELDKYLNEIK